MICELVLKQILKVSLSLTNDSGEFPLFSAFCPTSSTLYYPKFSVATLCYTYLPRDKTHWQDSLQELRILLSVGFEILDCRKCLLSHKDTCVYMHTHTRTHTHARTCIYAQKPRNRVHIKRSWLDLAGWFG